MELKCKLYECPALYGFNSVLSSMTDFILQVILPRIQQIGTIWQVIKVSLTELILLSTSMPSKLDTCFELIMNWRRAVELAFETVLILLRVLQKLTTVTMWKRLYGQWKAQLCHCFIIEMEEWHFEDFSSSKKDWNALKCNYFTGGWS